jgi:cation transport ATPase
MTSTLTDAPIRTGGRVVARPPSIFVTGSRLREVRWAALAFLLFVIAWPLQLAGAPAPLWWGIYLACYLAGGWEPAWAGISALRARVLDVDLLMIVAAIAAAAIGQIFDGALLIVIFATSGALEALVTQRTADSVSSLLTLAPERATRIRRTAGGDELSEVDTAELAVGDLILIRPGERIGGDGTVVEGISEVDQAAMPGESVPVRRGEGDEVLSGTVNGTGSLTVQISRPASESVIARVVSLVAEASETKSNRQLFIEKVEQRYSLGVVAATLLVFFLPLVFGEDLTAALLRAITFMIVASPCAVVLSTMPPLLAAIANAGRNGILIKSATVMERLGRTQLVAFDKTGTLTEGAPVIRQVLPAAGYTSEQLVRLAAAVEQHSEHPLARAVLRAAGPVLWLRTSSGRSPATACRAWWTGSWCRSASPGRSIPTSSAPSSTSSWTTGSPARSSSMTPSAPTRKRPLPGSLRSRAGRCICSPGTTSGPQLMSRPGPGSRACMPDCCRRTRPRPCSASRARARRCCWSATA